jgi:PAS domain S-box-containing protein
MVTAVARDVTYWRLAAEAAAHQASIIQSSHDAVISNTLEHVITSWNPGAERLYGYTAEEMTGRHIEVIIPMEDRQREVGVLSAVARGERVEQYQARRSRKDGTTVEVSLTMCPIADRGGAVVGVASVARDVTERQRAEARFRGLLDAVPDAMVCIRDDGRIALVNAQTERLFGYRRDELVGQPVEILVPDAIRGAHLGHRAGYEADPQPRPMGAGSQLAGRRRDASTFPADISLSTIDTEEGPLITAAVRDMTEHQQVKDLERANRDMEAFAYSVAHDLRAPLRALSGFSEALLEDYEDTFDDEGRDYAGRIVEASEQMATLIDDLLRLSRISRAEVHLHAVDLGAEVTRIAEELQRGHPGRRVSFAIQQPVQVQADPGLICTVLQNLLENAWKFTSGQHKASIEFGAIPAGDGRLGCYVRDNGAGFDPAYSNQLFQPFQRLHKTREFPGTGVGLASVRQIVERHGGCVRAEGAIGKGAAFHFTLKAEEIT